MDYMVLTAGWVVYFLLHSLLAADNVKRMAARILGKAFRWYRAFYSVISTAGLVGLMFLNGGIPSDYFFDRSGIVRFLSLVLTTFGVMTVQLAFRQYRLKAFLGFAEETGGLKIDGVLKYVRHPIYSGLILITLGFFLFIPNRPTLLSCACILTYLPIGILLEERKLILAFGDAYRNYREQVPSLIPKFPLNPSV